MRQPVPVDPLVGGADRARTDDLLSAIQALSQLSYSPLALRKVIAPDPGLNVRAARGRPLALPARGRPEPSPSRAAERAIVADPRPPACGRQEAETPPFLVTAGRCGYAVDNGVEGGA